MKFLVTQLNSCYANFTGQAGGAGFTQWNWRSQYSTGQVGTENYMFAENERIIT